MGASAGVRGGLLLHPRRCTRWPCGDEGGFLQGLVSAIGSHLPSAAALCMVPAAAAACSRCRAGWEQPGRSPSAWMASQREQMMGMGAGGGCAGAGRAEGTGGGCLETRMVCEE